MGFSTPICGWYNYNIVILSTFIILIIKVGSYLLGFTVVNKRIKKQMDGFIAQSNSELGILWLSITISKLNVGQGWKIQVPWS